MLLAINFLNFDNLYVQIVYFNNTFSYFQSFNYYISLYYTYKSVNRV